MSSQILREGKLSDVKHLNNTVRQFAINCQDQTAHAVLFKPACNLLLLVNLSVDENNNKAL